MFQALDQGRTPVGTILLAPGAEWVEILGAAGLDYACIDLMMTAIDWNQAANMVRAALLYDMTPWVRVQSYPWAPGGGADSVVKDVLRALSIGAECVTASIDTPDQVEALVSVGTDLHRRPYIAAHQYQDVVSLERARGEAERSTWLFPLLESQDALDNLDQILGVAGLKAVFLGMGDLTELVGHPGDYNHPDVTGLIRSVANRAHARGVAVVANHLSGSTPREVRAGVDLLSSLGVDVAWIPYPTTVVSQFYRRVMREASANQGD